MSIEHIHPSCFITLLSKPWESNCFFLKKKILINYKLYDIISSKEMRSLKLKTSLYLGSLFIFIIVKHIVDQLTCVKTQHKTNHGHQWLICLWKSAIIDKDTTIFSPFIILSIDIKILKSKANALHRSKWELPVNFYIKLYVFQSLLV